MQIYINFDIPSEDDRKEETKWESCRYKMEMWKADVVPRIGSSIWVLGLNASSNILGSGQELENDKPVIVVSSGESTNI